MDIKTFLKQYINKNIYYKANPGNGGDSLIAVGAFDLMDSIGLNYKIIGTPKTGEIENEIVLYAGGGNLISEYQQCADFLSEYHTKCKEIILLPHTINSNKELLESLGENVTIFCREKYSFNYLKSLNLNCNYYLDHDLAVHINLKKLENYTGKTPFALYKRIIKSKIKNIIASPLTINAFRVDIEKTNITIPEDNIDLSHEVNYQSELTDPEMARRTAAHIFKTLKYFSKVNTNRLHISIAAGMLKKNVNLYPNSYWKNQAMYESTIEKFYPSVSFIKNE